MATSILSLVLSAWAATTAPAEASAKPPNVLLIMCDQLTASTLGCYGGPVPTPHIDRLAREGVLFTQATCPTPFCSPTRASMITGRYPHAHGIVVNCRQGKPQATSPGVTTADQTTERRLNELGYETHHYGKWHLFGDRLPYYTDTYNVDEEYLQEMSAVFERVRQTPREDWMEWYVWALPVTLSPAVREPGRKLAEQWKSRSFADFVLKMGRLDLPPGQCFDVRVADLTERRLRDLGGRGRPFMVTCSFNGPHDPNVVPSPYYEAFDPAKIELPANRNVRESRFEKDWSRQIITGLGEPGLREFLRIYYGTIQLLDDQVGRVLAALEATGQADNTIVAFTADHGDMAGGHGMVWKSTEAFYDETVRVPLIIRAPGRLKPGRSELVTDLTDLSPTLLELCGQPPLARTQGQSLVPFVTGAGDPAKARRYAFSERIKAHAPDTRELGPGSTGTFMIRGQGWKYIRYPGPKAQQNEFLYHLAEDPGETRNLAANPAAAEKRRELSRELDAWLTRTDWPG